VDIAAADSASGDADKDFIGSGFWGWDMLQLQVEVIRKDERVHR
jgi:hypothetical protein